MSLSRDRVDAVLLQVSGGTIESFDAWYRRVASDGTSPIASIRRDERAWISRTQEYRPELLRRFVRVSDISVRLSVRGREGECGWRIGGRPLERGRCDGHVAAIPRGGALVVASGKRFDAIEETVRPERLVVLALGDSYASGEGNPDDPTDWESKDPFPGGYDWLRELRRGDAVWSDRRCHRSFWSHQTYTALRLASEDSHRQVVYLHYACSGAEILDGLLIPQSRPAGGGRQVSRSQLRYAVEDLCTASCVTQSANVDRVAAAMKQLARRGEKIEPRDLVACPDTRLVRPDLVLLSIGGNDIGFGGLVLWALLPNNARSLVLEDVWQRYVRGNAVVCPIGTDRSSMGCRAFQADLLERFPNKLRVLAIALDELLGVERRRIVLATYPDPIRTGTPAHPFCHDAGDINHDNAWDGMRFVARESGMPGTSRWRINILESEAEVLAERAIPPVRSAQQGVADAVGWTFAGASADAFVGHGFCAHASGDPPIRLPSTYQKPWRGAECAAGLAGPACWRPYAPMERYVRTMNDSLLTQSSARIDDHTGTAHPTAQGQAAIAEAIYPKVISALAGP